MSKAKRAVPFAAVHASLPGIQPSCLFTPMMFPILEPRNPTPVQWDASGQKKATYTKTVRWAWKLPKPLTEPCSNRSWIGLPPNPKFEMDTPISCVYICLISFVVASKFQWVLFLHPLQSPIISLRFLHTELFTCICPSFNHYGGKSGWCSKHDWQCSLSTLYKISQRFKRNNETNSMARNLRWILVIRHCKLPTNH